MVAISRQSEVVVFPCEEWPAMRKPTGELVSIHPIRGSWTLLGGEDRRRMADQKLNVKGMIACPRCSHSGFIPEGFDPPKELGDGKPDHEFVCRQCKFACRIVLKNWDRRLLYCIAYETKQGDTLKPHKEYLHAENEDEAKKFFWASHGNQVSIGAQALKDGTITHIVGVAPVVGFFATDKNEKKLIV